MDNNKALQKLLNGTATKKEIESLKQAVASGEISIGGDVNRSVVIIGSGNKVELTAEALGILKPNTKTEEPIAGESPYMGLRYFDTSDADLFYGREALTAELLKRVKNESFLAIVGASGSGKSSVARAGLIPVWKKENERGIIHIITPTTHPLESLASSLTRDSESVTATSTLMDDMNKDVRSLRLYVKKTFGEAKLLLLVDQFEETFTLCKDLAERKAFIENLLSIAEADGTVRVVITLRADFYHHCFEYEGLRLTLEKHQANLGAMTQEELREAILKPAETNGWDFQPGLVDLILQDIGSEPGALPLLSHALLETWKRRQGRTLTLQGYHDAGGVKKAITQTAESVYDKLSKEEQGIARNIFLRLTELGEGVQDTRRRVNLGEFLLFDTENQNDITKVLMILIDSRLVTTEQESCIITHEALISHWERLRKWLAENRRFLIWRQKINYRYIDWQKNKGEVLQDSYLIEAEAWLLEQGSLLSTGERRFIEESISSRDKRKRVLRNINLGFLVSYMLFAMITGVIGIYVITRLATFSFSERLTNQLLEAGRSVSDSFARQEIQHVKEALRIIYTEGLSDAIIKEDYETALKITEPILGLGTIDNLILISPKGSEVLHLIRDSYGNITIVDQDTGASHSPIATSFLEDQNPDAPPQRALGNNLFNNELYYYTALPISANGNFNGVIIVGTSIKTLLPSFKKISLVDIVIYVENGQVVATTLGSDGIDTAEIVAISQNQFQEIIRTDEEIVWGENTEIAGRQYIIGRAPLQVGNTRVAVFAVALPSDVIIQFGVNSRKVYQGLFFILFLIEIIVGFAVWRSLIIPLYSLEKVMPSNKHRSNIEKNEKNIIFFLLSFGLILILGTGQIANRTVRFWSVNAEMSSDLRLEFTPVNAVVLKPISGEILTPPSWADTFLTPLAPPVIVQAPFISNNLSITPTSTFTPNLNATEIP